MSGWTELPRGAFEVAVVSEPEIQCATCGRAGVKLFRPYQTFHRPDSFRCRLHMPRNWYVPLMVEPSDGTIWGLHAAPEHACEAWYALPDVLPEELPTKGIWLEVETLKTLWPRLFQDRAVWKMAPSAREAYDELKAMLKRIDKGLKQ